ncbi:MAG TPA: pitrilysin family protein [Gemmatimonadaceae bacterium]|nr:pitrilysin family protein [Gemmatimonadaceae bacterium]
MNRIPAFLLSLLAVASIAAPASSAAQGFPPTPPPPGPIQPAKFPPYQEATLPNGMRLVLVASHEHPVVSVSLSLPAGSKYEPAGKEGLATMTAALLTKGAGNRSAEDFARTIEGVGGQINAAAGSDFITVFADVLAPDAPLAFDMLADAVVRPTFPDKEVELQRTQQLSALQLQLSQPAALASRFFEQGLYGTGAYGRFSTPASVRSITRQDLVAFQKARFRPGGALLVIAGDITMDRARSLATKSFAGWSGARPAAQTFPAPPARNHTEILLVHRPGSVQSNIVAGNTTFLPTDPRWYPAVVANQVLGGGADARLFLILREQKSWTYGAYSDLDRPQGIGYFQASTEVRTPVTDSALAEMLHQLRRIRSEAVPDSELAAAKNSLVGQFPLTIETANQVAGAVSNALLLGLPRDYLTMYRTRLAGVTAQQLRNAASFVVRPDSMLIVVVGDGSKIYDGLAKIAPVRIIDVEGKPLTPDDLVAKGSTLSIDAAALTARTDSFTIMVQGQAFGYQTGVLSKTADGYQYEQHTEIGPMLQQKSTVTFTEAPALQHIAASGTLQGQQLSVDITVTGGHAKGTASVPGPQGPHSVETDTDVPPGTMNDDVLRAIIPALPWSAGAKWSFPSLDESKGTVQQLTISVDTTESVTLPDGAVNAYRASVTGGEQPITLWVSVAAPHELLKVTIAGAPITFVRAKK